MRNNTGVFDHNYHISHWWEQWLSLGRVIGDSWWVKMYSTSLLEWHEIVQYHNMQCHHIGVSEIRKCSERYNYLHCLRTGMSIYGTENHGLMNKKLKTIFHRNDQFSGINYCWWNYKIKNYVSRKLQMRSA